MASAKIDIAEVVRSFRVQPHRLHALLRLLRRLWYLLPHATARIQPAIAPLYYKYPAAALCPHKKSGILYTECPPCTYSLSRQAQTPFSPAPTEGSVNRHPLALPLSLAHFRHLVLIPAVLYFPLNIFAACHCLLYASF
jgi:hypothetical protein